MAKTIESQRTWEQLNAAFDFYYYKAVAAYERRCNKEGGFPMIPSKNGSCIDEVKGKFFIRLHNRYDQLDSYEILSSGRIRREIQ